MSVMMLLLLLLLLLRWFVMMVVFLVVVDVDVVVVGGGGVGGSAVSGSGGAHAAAAVTARRCCSPPPSDASLGAAVLREHLAVRGGGLARRGAVLQAHGKQHHQVAAVSTKRLPVCCPHPLLAAPPQAKGGRIKRADTSLCTCLHTQNIRKRQVHFQSPD